MLPDAKARIDGVCRAWAEDTGEPFVTLVARHGVIVTHAAFGGDLHGNPISHDYRCWVASVTKTVTALLFSRFLDQGLIALDDSLSTVFPDYPKNDPQVPRRKFDGDELMGRWICCRTFSPCEVQTNRPIHSGQVEIGGAVGADGKFRLQPTPPIVIGQKRHSPTTGKRQLPNGKMHRLVEMPTFLRCCCDLPTTGTIPRED